jgi:outer membrane protein
MFTTAAAVSVTPLMPLSGYLVRHWAKIVKLLRLNHIVWVRICYNYLLINTNSLTHPFSISKKESYAMNIRPSLQVCVMTVFTALSPFAVSDTILGLYAGVGIWQADVEGNASEAGTGTSLDINDSFGSVDDDSNFLYVALEHPIPIIPNIMIQQTDVSIDKNGTLSSNVTFDGEPFTAGAAVSTTIDFSHTDATLYYELLDNWITVDFGLTFRSFDGELTLRETTAPFDTATQELDGVLPMLYLKGRADLPFSGFYVSAHTNALTYDGHSLTDISAAVGYQTDGWVMDLGLELGIRTFTFELDDLDDLDADIDLSGTYAVLTIHF